MCFSSSPAAPAPPPPPPAPIKAADKRVAAAGKSERTRSGKGGRKSTILTGPLGLSSDAQVQRKTLLGA